MPLWNVFNDSVPAEEHFVQFTLIDAKERVMSSNYLFPLPIKKAKGVRNLKPEVAIQSTSCDASEQTVTLSVRTTVPILFFYIDILNEGIKDFQLSDNGFTIVEPVTLLTVTHPNADCAGPRLAVEDLRVYTVNQYM